MAWFIIQCERKTWTKFLVEAENEEAAMENDDNWEYLGYVDGEDMESTAVGGSFEDRSQAFDDISSYVDG